MEIGVAGKWVVFAYGLPDHASAGQAITGDAANITANIRIDGAAANAVDDVNPTELEDGYYIFDITAVESDGDLLLLAPASSTANVQVIAVPGVVYTRPANFNVLGIAADGDISGNVDGSVASVTAQVTADMTAISGDSAAADNLESQYDGTGLSGDTFPATQSQLSGLANVGSAIHRPAASYVLTTGTQTAHTYDKTAALDEVRHTHTDTAGAIDYYYEFNIGSGTASSTLITGFVTGSNDDVDIYGYDWVAAGWVQIGNISGSSSTDNQVNSFDLFVDMVGSGTDKGKVQVRIYKASGLSTATVAIDQIFVAYNQGADGYDLGMIWYDDTATNTNTVVGVDGTSTNPVSTEAAVNTLIASTGLNRVNVAPGSAYVLEADIDKCYMTGRNWTLALAGFSIASAYIENANVSGIAAGATTPFFKECSIGNVTIPPSAMDRCGYMGTVTVGSAGDFFIIDGFSQVSGASSPVWDMAAIGASNVSIRRFGGGHSVTNIATGDVISAEATVGGTLTVNGTGGEIHPRGMWKGVTDSSGALVSITDSAISLTNINVECDTAISDASLATAAALATVDGNVDAILVDTSTTLENHLTDIKGGAFAGATDSLEAIRDRGDAAWVTGAGGSAPSVIEIRTEMDSNSTKLAAIAADTEELQTDDVPGLIGALNDVAATDIVSAGAITTLTGAVVNVDLVDTTTVNTDMRGTDSAATAAALAVVDSVVDAILADTSTDGVVLTAATLIAIADKMLDRDLATGTDSGSPTVRTVRQALRMSRNKVSISGGTLTVMKENDTTASWTAAVTTTAGDPISTVDPA